MNNNNQNSNSLFNKVELSEKKSEVFDQIKNDICPPNSNQDTDLLTSQTLKYGKDFVNELTSQIFLVSQKLQKQENLSQNQNENENQNQFLQEEGENSGPNNCSQSESQQQLTQKTASKINKLLESMDTGLILKLERQFTQFEKQSQKPENPLQREIVMEKVDELKINIKILQDLLDQEISGFAQQQQIQKYLENLEAVTATVLENSLFFGQKAYIGYLLRFQRNELDFMFRITQMYSEHRDKKGRNEGGDFFNFIRQKSRVRIDDFVNNNKWQMVI